MNELIAIVLIVIVCCSFFFAWLISMATCPDTMVNLISGNSSTASSTPKYSQQRSYELMPLGSARDIEIGSKDPEAQEAPVSPVQVPALIVEAPSLRATSSKKLSIVPEQDETAPILAPPSTYVFQTIPEIVIYTEDELVELKDAVPALVHDHHDLHQPEQFFSAPQLNSTGVNDASEQPQSSEAKEDPDLDRAGDRLFKCYSVDHVADPGSALA